MLIKADLIDAHTYLSPGRVEFYKMRLRAGCPLPLHKSAAAAIASASSTASTGSAPRSSKVWRKSKWRDLRDDN